MMKEQPTSSTFRSVALDIIATASLVAVGYAVSEGYASDLLVGLALAAAAVLLAFVSPAAGISVVVLAAPTMYDLHPMPSGEFGLLELAILASAMGVGARMVFDAVRTDGLASLLDILKPAHIVVPVALLLVATFVSLVTLANPDYRTESLREVRTVILEPLIFLANARMAMRRQRTRAFAGSMLILGGAAVAAYGVVQVAFDLGGVQAGDLTRATATYTHPNNLALFLERSLLLTIGVIFVRPRWWPAWLLAAVQLVGVLATFSRGAFIALVVGLVVILVLRRLYAWLLAVVAGGVGVAAAGLVLFPERLIDAGGDGAEPTRFTIWRASWRMVVDHPVFGVGPDQFLYQYGRRYIEPMGWPERYTSHPHNLVLDVWLRLGVVGLAAASSLAVGLVWWVRRNLRTIRDDPWSTGALAALVGGIAHGMLDNGFFLPDLATLTWFFVAVIITVPVARTVEEGDAKDNRSPMERTWPGMPGASQSGTSAVGRPKLNKSWMVPLLVGAFVALSLIPSNGYMAFSLIAIAGIVTILNAPIGIAAVVLSVPLQEAYTVPFVRGDLTYTQVLLAGLVLGWAVTFYRYRIWLDSVVLGFLAIFSAFSISLVAMDDPGLWFGEVYRWAAAAIFFVVCRSVLRSWPDIVPSVWAMVAGVLGVSAHAFWQLINDAGPANFIVGGSMRVYSTFGTPNTLAAYVEFTVPLLLVFALFGVKSSIRTRIGTPVWLASIVASGAGMLTLGLTQSRGGLIGMVVALITVLFILPRRLQVATVVAGVVVIGAFLVTTPGQSQFQRFTDLFEEEETLIQAEHKALLGRGSLWGAAIRMIEDEPLTGVGAGEYDYHYREYTPGWLDRFPRGQAHNGWLQMGAQAGVPGMLAFTAWVAASLGAVGGAIRRAQGELPRLVACGAIAILLAFTIHSLVDYLNVLSLGVQLSMITAAGLALSPDPLPTSKRDPVEGAIIESPVMAPEPSR